MSSSAYQEWIGVRRNRIDELLSAHASVGGNGPGRRWRTQQLNWSLTFRLAGEFQGFALTPLELTCSTAGSSIRVMRNQAHSVVTSRASVLWPALKTKSQRADKWNSELESLNLARNAIAHDDHVPGADEDVTLTLPAEALEATDLPDKPQPGSWVGYWHQVEDAFNRVLPRVSKNAVVYIGGPDELDMKIQIDETAIAIEVKFISSRSRASADLIRLASHIAAKTSLPVLLVTNIDPPTIRIMDNVVNLGRVQAYFARWRSPADDINIESGIRWLLGAS